MPLTSVEFDSGWILSGSTGSIPSPILQAVDVSDYSYANVLFLASGAAAATNAIVYWSEPKAQRTGTIATVTASLAANSSLLWSIGPGITSGTNTFNMALPRQIIVALVPGAASYGRILVIGR